MNHTKANNGDLKSYNPDKYFSNVTFKISVIYIIL